jgi:hypothetical protein
MTKLDKMWALLEKYQKEADKRGHGESWAEMCRLKTADAAWDASVCVHIKAAADAAYAKTAYLAADVAANVVAWAALAASDAAYNASAADRADCWARRAIYYINKATGDAL